MKSPTPMKLGREKSHDRDKGYFEQFLRFLGDETVVVRGGEKAGSMSHKVLFSTVVS